MTCELFSHILVWNHSLKYTNGNSGHSVERTPPLGTIFKKLRGQTASKHIEIAQNLD